MQIKCTSVFMYNHDILKSSFQRLLHEYFYLLLLKKYTLTPIITTQLSNLLCA